MTITSLYGTRQPSIFMTVAMVRIGATRNNIGNVIIIIIIYAKCLERTYILVGETVSSDGYFQLNHNRSLSRIKYL